MKNTLTVAILAIAISILSQTAYSQGFPYHLYDTRTLAELVELNSGVKKTAQKDVKNIMISAKPFYSAVRVEYAGQSRKLSKDKLGLFKVWEESLNVKSTNTNFSLFELLDKEFLFKECDKEYWVPVQTPAANDFPQDMKKGDKITLYLMVVGGIETNGEWEFVYLTNSFKIY